MSASLAKQFEVYAARCLELARRSKTRAGRSRFMQMAREYQSAALIQKELSSDLRSAGAHHVGLQARGTPRLSAPAAVMAVRLQVIRFH